MSTIGSREFKFSVKLNWIIGISGAGLVLIAAYIFQPEWREHLKFIAPVIGGTAALIAAVNAIDSRVAATKQAQRVAALDFVTRWMNPAFFYAKRNGRDTIKFFRDNTSVDLQRQHLDGDPTVTANVYDVLNVFEQMSIAVQTKMVDEEILKRFFYSLLMEYWHTFEGVLKARRAERCYARLLQETEWLFNHWRT